MKKYLSRVLQFVAFVVILCGLYAGFDYIISDDTASHTRVSFHDYYEAGKLDYLFVGPSHINHEVNAVQLSEKLQNNVYNLSSNSQDLIGSYYIIKEAANQKKTDRIFLELSASRLNVKTANETSVYIITDYMKSPLLKVKYILSSFGTDKYTNSFLRLRRNIDPQDLPSAKELAELYKKKSERTYYDYLGSSHYMGKGQWDLEESWADEVTGTAALNLKAKDLDNFSADEIQEKQWNHLLKIIELCNDENIELTFIIPPYSELYLNYFEEYESVTEKFYEVAEENGIAIVDFNRVKEEYLDIGLKDFYNADHVVSGKSEDIADFLAEYIENPDGDYFHDSLEEKYPKNDDIIAVGYNRFFVTEKGEYQKKDSAKGTIDSMRLEISAFSRIERPVDVRLYVAEKPTDDETVRVSGKEIVGKKLDEYKTQFTVPYDELETNYKIELLDPDTNEVLYETVSRFNMD